MKRMLTLLLAVLTLAAFAACGNKPDSAAITDTPATTAEPDSVDVANLEPDTTAAPETDTSEPGTTEPTETTTAETTTADSTTTTTETTTRTAAAIATPQGAAAIVKFYNSAANNSKNQQNFSVVKDEKLDVHLTEGFLKAADGVLDMLRQDLPNQKETYTNGQPANYTDTPKQDFLPVKGQSYMSRLQPEWVESASCVKNADGTFTVKFTLKEETFDPVTEDGPHHHSCMDTLDIEWDELPFEVRNGSGRIHDATFSAAVASDGTLLKELHIYEPMEVRGQVKFGVWMKMVVEGYWKQDLKFSW